MSKYLKLFETTSQYETYINGSDVVLPNVSVAKDAPTTVYYKPVPPMNIITYEASAKLAETTRQYSSGLHTNAFSGTSGLLTMTSHTFENNVGTIEFDGDVTSIGDDAFSGCTGLTRINIPNTVTKIGASAFGSCTGLTSITIPDNVTSIGAAAFRGCKGLTSITIPDSVTWIGDTTFSYCTGLTSVTIGSGVTSLYDYIFMGCTSLTSITSNATTAPTIKSQTFKNVKTDGTLYVPSGSTGYNVWMRTDNYYLGYYNWTKVEQ